MKKTHKTHKTRKAAVGHLEKLGWKQIGTSIGDIVLACEGKSFVNIVSQLKGGQWAVNAYGWTPLDKKSQTRA